MKLLATHNRLHYRSLCLCVCVQWQPSFNALPPSSSHTIILASGLIPLLLPMPQDSPSNPPSLVIPHCKHHRLLYQLMKTLLFLRQMMMMESLLNINSSLKMGRSSNWGKLQLGFAKLFCSFGIFLVVLL